MAKKIEYLTDADRKWLRKTFTEKERGVCELIWGGVPLYEESFVRASNRFKEAMSAENKEEK